MVDSPRLPSDSEAVDDCWNRIGVHGDKSCVRLTWHVHCRNCEVYSAAAVRLLERYGAVQEEAPAQEQEEDLGECRSWLIFRLGQQWLGLPTGRVDEVVAPRPIHSLPHQRSRSLLGVGNVHGVLLACLSLTELLGLKAEQAAVPAQPAAPRMLILGGQGGQWLVPVDEVAAIESLPLQAVAAVAGAGGQGLSRFASGVLQWRGRSITLLDEVQLFQAMEGCLR